MEKDQLIELWMANGFISTKGHMDLHDMGNEIFSELVWRSLFQDVKEDIWGRVTCKMHDLFHDLAQSIIRHECCLIDLKKEKEVSRGIRHLAMFQVGPWRKELLKSQSLRSFIFLDGNRRSGTLLPAYLFEQKYLRALDISGCNVNNLPKSVGYLKHLRYLNISNSSIKKLPESVSALQNLQTLNLKNCFSLSMLPKGMKHMKNLRYLDIESCDALRSMPVEMGQLTCLRKLTIFVVGKDGGQIAELGGLNYLEGELSIMDLENVRNLADAKNANLMSKKHLQSLSLYWRLYSPSENSEDILCGLQPHSSLKSLKISTYHGSKFPNWIMNLLLPNLVEIWLGWCYQCEQVPPLGKLQFLKRLHISGMDAVKCLGSEMYGNGEIAFPSLESLSLYSMYSLEELATVSGIDIFPCLRELLITSCPMLVKLPIIPTVRGLEIGESNVLLVRSVVNFSSLTSLRICSFPEVTILPEGLMQNHAHLVRMEIYDMKSLKSLSDQFSNLSTLKYLSLGRCDKLDSLPECLWNLNSLESLYIYGCMELNSLHATRLNGLSSLRKLTIVNCQKFAFLSEGLQCFTGLENLLIVDCPMLNSLPESIQHLTSLRYLRISDCSGLSCLPNQIGQLTMLAHLAIFKCPNLMSLPEEIQSLNMLRELMIGDCPNLQRLCEKETGCDWPKIAHIPTIYINGQLIQ